MRRAALQNLALVLVSIAGSWLLAEAGLRLLVQPSELGWGRLFGRDLPPLRIATAADIRNADPSEPEGRLVVAGRGISRGDVRGHFRPDPELGFTYQENAVSANGWWQSNNFGARARSDATRAAPADKNRLLVFGESFAHGSRLPQEDAWPSILDAAHPGLEVLNFAVDGYGMAQSLLRYRQIGPQLEHDAVLLMWVPGADLWRDVNILRWGLQAPRFVLEGGQLRLVLPYEDADSRQEEKPVGRGLHEHLRRYDRFYVPARYELPPVIGASLAYRLAATVYWERREQRLRAATMEPGSEALQVSRAIFAAMQAQAEIHGARFALAILPVDHKWREMPQMQAWRDLVAYVCVENMHCIDLLDALRQVDVEDIDYAYDGAHFGPATNRHIAAAIAAALEGELTVSSGGG